METHVTDDFPKLDRTAFAVYTSFEAAEADDIAYWHSRTSDERIAHMTLLRRINYGSAATERLLRVLEITTLEIR